MIDHLWDVPQRVPHPGLPALCNPFLWVWATPSDSLLRNRIWHKWWDITYKTRLQKRPWLPCWAPSPLALFSLFFSQNPCSRKSGALLWVVLGRGPHSKKLMRLANSQWGPEACQQPGEWGIDSEWILPKSSIEMTAVPDDTLTAALWDLEPEVPTKQYPDFWPTEMVI